jgi:Mu-like prophage I protein
MSISKTAIAALLKSQALASDEGMDPKAEDPASTEGDTTASEDLSDADLCSNLRELTLSESNAEVLSKVKAMIETAAASEAADEEQTAEEVVCAAIKAGKIAPAARRTAKALALADIESFRAFVATAPSVSVKRVAPVAASPAAIELTPEQKLACARVGSTEESFKATLARLQSKPIISKGNV